MNGKTVVHPFHVVLLKNKNKWIFAIVWMNMECIMQNEKRQNKRLCMLYDLIYMWYYGKTKAWGHNTNQWLSWAVSEERVLTPKGEEGTFGRERKCWWEYDHIILCIYLSS